MLKRIRLLLFIQALLIIFPLSILSQVMPSTVSQTQWQDSWLAKWQSDNPDDKNDALTQLAALHLLTEGKSKEIKDLEFKLKTLKGKSVDADAALAFLLLKSDFSNQAAKALLDLVLNYPDDHRVARFRIGLAQAFRQDNQFDLAASQLEPVAGTDTFTGLWATLEQARLYRAENDPESAIEKYGLIEQNTQSDYLRDLAHKEKLELTFNKIVDEEPLD